MAEICTTARRSLRIWPATRYDVVYVLANLRASDEYELAFNQRSRGVSPGFSTSLRELEGALREDTWAMWLGEEVIGLGGVAQVPQHLGVGAIWFLGTARADEKWRHMTTACRRMKCLFHKEWPTLGNVIPAGMTTRARWLEHLGFDFAPREAKASELSHVAFWSHGHAAQ